MTQSIKILKRLDWDVLKEWGFVQKEDLGHYRLCDLPVGWKFHENEREYLIVDDRGRYRIWGIRLHTSGLLYPRYEINPEYNDESCMKYRVYDRWERKILYSTRYTDCCLDDLDLPLARARTINADLIYQASDWIATHLNDKYQVIQSYSPWQMSQRLMFLRLPTSNSLNPSTNT